MQQVVDAAVTATNPITQQVVNHASTDIPSQREGGATRGRRVAGGRPDRRRAAGVHPHAAGVRQHRLASAPGCWPGPVTYGDLFTMQPFQDDYVDTFTLTGAQVWALLNQQLAAGTGGIMQVSGLHFTYTGTQGCGIDHRCLAGRGGRQLATRSRTTRRSATPAPRTRSWSAAATGSPCSSRRANIVQTADAELVPLRGLRRLAARPVHVHDRRADPAVLTGSAAGAVVTMRTASTLRCPHCCRAVPISRHPRRR